MEIKKGIGVSPGVVISTAIVLDAEDLAIPKRNIDPGQLDSEVARFHDALEKSVLELELLRTAVAEKYAREIGAIFDFHIGVLKDKAVITPIVNTIRSEKVTAEYAVSTIMRRYASNFLKISDRYLADRVKDIYDIERRVLKNLIGRKTESLGHLSSDTVVIAHDLLPSQTA